MIQYLFPIMLYQNLINFYNQHHYFFQQVFMKKLFKLIEITLHNLINYRKET